MNRAVDYPEALGFVRAFAEGLAELGWVTGQNVRIDYRWYAGDADAARKYAAELTTLEPDIFLASGTLGSGASKPHSLRANRIHARDRSGRRGVC
jgi:hypothetical protein